MADKKTTALTAITAPATADVIHIVDVSDTTDDAGGSSRKITLADLAKAFKIEREYAISDESTALTTGTGKLTFRMPHGMTVTEVRASVLTAPTGSTIIVDINEAGASILSTKLSIDATEKTSTTASTAPVISDATLADDAEITVDIDQVGSSVAGVGLKIVLIGYRT